MSKPLHKNLLWALFRVPVYLYRWRLGWIFGNRFLLLTHVGRRTLRRHQTVLEVIEHRRAGPEFVVISGFGPTADWLKNIEVGPASIEVGLRSFAADHRFLPEKEAVSVIREYEHRNRFLQPIVRAVLTRLLGWKYSGTDSDRHRLVTRLPLIAFRPQHVA
jgi:deazaflavin-dependent oxidoreductase (nitroreductase family)